MTERRVMFEVASLREKARLLEGELSSLVGQERLHALVSIAENAIEAREEVLRENATLRFLLRGGRS